MRKQYNPGISTLIKKAFALASLDGGKIIAVRVATFLLLFFTIKSGILTEQRGFNLDVVAVVLLCILSGSAIIVRVTGLNFGLKYPFISCFRQALRRLPATLSLCCIAVLFFIFIVAPLESFMGSLNLYALSILLTCATYLFIQIAINYVVMEETNSIDAIAATIRLLVKRINWRLTFNLVCLYCIPLSIITLLPVAMIQNFAKYLMLASVIWMLFCDIVTITIFSENIPRKIKKRKTNTRVKTFVA